MLTTRKLCWRMSEPADFTRVGLMAILERCPELTEGRNVKQLSRKALMALVEASLRRPQLDPLRNKVRDAIDAVWHGDTGNRWARKRYLSDR